MASKVSIAVIKRRTRSVVRIALPLLVIAACLSSFVPLISVAAGNTCALECCAGRAPHAAGSCMDGTCHAAIRRRTVAHHSKFAPSERLCGAQSIVAKHRATIARAAAKTNSRSSTVEARMLTKPCLPECASCSGFAPSNNLSKTAAMTTVDGPRPPPNTLTVSDNDGLSEQDSICCRRSPRGPPPGISA